MGYVKNFVPFWILDWGQEHPVSIAVFGLGLFLRKEIVGLIR